MSTSPAGRELDTVALLLWVRELLDDDDPRGQIRVLRRTIDHLMGSVLSIDWAQVARVCRAACPALQCSPRGDRAALAAVRMAAVAAAGVNPGR